MKDFQISCFAELFEQVHNNTEYSDIPDEDLEDFHIFLRLMESRTPEEIEDISFEKVLYFLDQLPQYVKYFAPTDQYIETYQKQFIAAKSKSVRRVL